MPATPPMQALVQSLGHALAVYGGARVTRLSASAQVGDLALAVEGAAWAPASGKVRVDNATYAYTSVDPIQRLLQGITFSVGGTPVPGAQAPHLAGTGVTLLDDGSSDLQGLKDCLFTDTAEGEALAVIGRFLGVPHVATLSSDAQYRALIQAVAYKPRATAWALTSGLDAILGKGTYQVIEDPRTPGTVTVQVPYASVQSTQSIGHTYLSSAAQLVAAADGTVSIPGPAFGHAALLLAPERQSFLASNGPLAAQADASGDTFWAAPSGGQPGTTTQGTATYQTLAGPNGQLTTSRTLRLMPGCTVGVSAEVVVAGAQNLSATDGRGCAIWVADGGQLALVGATCQADGTVLWALRDASGNSLGAGATVAAGQQVGLSVRLDGARALLIVGTVTAAQLPRSTLPAASVRQLGLGAYQSSSQGAWGLSIRQIALYGRCDTDFGLARGTDAQLQPGGTVASYGGQPARAGQATLPSLTLSATDVGAQMVISSGPPGVPGRYVVQAVTGTNVAQLTAPFGPAAATVNVRNGQNFLIGPSPRAFCWPDDLGKQVVIADNSAGNAGVYQVADIYDDGSGKSFGSYLTPLKGWGTTARIGTSALNPQASVAYALWPNFAAASNACPWTFGDALQQATSAQGTTWTPRQPLPIAGARYQMAVSEVLGGYLETQSAPTTAVDPGPPVTADTYPFYVEAPLGALEDVLGQLTPAGSTIAVAYS